jgi:glycosyltransferase involved in cell wall biosynthesis
MKNKYIKIGIVTFPISEAGTTPLSNLVYTLCFLSGKIFLITGGAGYTTFANNKQVYAYNVEHSARARHTFRRIVNYIKTQVIISTKLWKLRKQVDIWVFFIGAEGLILPIFIAKLLNKKVIIASAGSLTKSAQAANDVLAGSLALLQSFTYNLADRIILYSNGLIEEHSLQKYKSKISITQNHFVNFNLFKIDTQLNARRDLIGYIGRFSEEKGILNFVKAIPAILKEKHEFCFLIGGDGQLKDEIEKYSTKYNLGGKINITGWISHDKLPHYLNELKLIVLPSYTEGLPNIMLEAMACGTPILASPVGAIPDLIKDGETGFIMADNSPECIARNIIRALNHPYLEKIADNGRALVEKEFTFEKAVERYRELLNSL